MLNSLNKKHPYYNDLKLNLRAITGICLGIFLFLLFFQPLNPQNPDFNNKLLILAAFGVISLILFGLLRIIIPSAFPRFFSSEKWTLNKEIFWCFLFVVFNSVAFVFFARYVGKIPITFHIVTIIIIITLSAVVILVVVNEYHYLKNQLIELKKETTYEKPKNRIEESDKIKFLSDNKTEYFHLFLHQIILIKSANNYIEVIYKEDEKINKRLIRNTLKNTEDIFTRYPSMVRCHRSCMVNKNYIQKVVKDSDGLKLSLFEHPKEIHVSRQYVLKVKEALETT